jgi:aminoglycoside phosphotransferase family enzyme
MQVTIKIKQDNGETIEIVKELNSFEDQNIIDSVEQQMSSIRQELFPLLSEQLIEHHQKGFKGEKNKEKERE